ncbi:MAG: protein kinase [Planctomycetaceae bacterium]|nr:protein kinase [Planctomycetaceae bacterium]
MTPEDYRKTTEQFLRLCDLSVAARDEALQQLQRDHPAVHKAVQGMLQRDQPQETRFRVSPHKTVLSDEDGQNVADESSAEQAGTVLVSAIERGHDDQARYQLTKLHATGGMGRIWLARDNAIGRNVALKELRPETPSATGIWQRFLNEAKVTGQLEHPGIVPVYEVDAADEDRPFYTMRFVKGQTLHEATREFTRLRQDGKPHELPLRELITALTGVANAIGYAHSRGVLHRDLKGHNVVLGDYGEVIVLDWGLACIVGADGEAGEDELPISGSGVSDQTNAGQIIGTPAYMSPEQAMGRRSDMNTRTDVFGLGGILYEILTGRAPYRGDTPTETLEAARQGAPVSPTDIWPDAPPALVAICRRAMSVRQFSRYESAVAFADELRRWQADEPVAAYPDPLLTRLHRWVRRHQTLAASLSALMLSAVIGLAVSTVLISSEQQRTEVARARAEANLSKAREAVRTMLTEVGDRQLEDVPQMGPLRQRLLQKALEFNQGFLKESNDPEVRLEAGMAYGDVAKTQDLLGRPDEAMQAWQNGTQILQALHEEFPQNDVYTREFADHLLGAALSSQKMERLEGAGRLAETALALFLQLRQRKAASADQLATQIGQCYSVAAINDYERGDFAAAITGFEFALQAFADGSTQASPQVTGNRASVMQQLSVVLMAAGRPKQARERLEELDGLTASLVAASPLSRECRDLRSACLDTLADCCRVLGDRPAGHAYAVEALGVRRQLAADFPYVAGYRSTAISSAVSVAILFAEAGDMPQAEKYFLEGEALARALADEFPHIPDYQFNAAAVIRSVGAFHFNTRQQEKCEAALRDCISRLDPLIEQFPDNPHYQLEKAVALHPLARTLRHQGDTEEAVATCRIAIQINEGLLESKLDIVRVRHKLAQDYRLMGELLAEQSEDDQAESFLRKALSLHRQTFAEYEDVSEHHRWVAVSLDKLAEFLVQRNPEEALVAIEESIAIRRQLASEIPDWLPILCERPGSVMTKGRIYEAMHDDTTAAESFQQATILLTGLIEQFPGESNLRAEHATALESLAGVQQRTGQLSEALSSVQQAHQILVQFAADFPTQSRTQQLLIDNLHYLADIHEAVGDTTAAQAARAKADDLASTPFSRPGETSPR